MYLSIGGGGFLGRGSFGRGGLFSGRGSGSSWGVGRGRGVLDGGGSVLDGGRGVSGGRSVSGGRDVGLSLGVDGDTLVAHLGDVAVDMVSGVLDVLGTTVGKGNRVATGNGTVGIGGLGGVELSLGVVVGNTVFVGIGGGHLLLNVGGGRGVIGSGGGGVVRGGSGGDYLNDGGVMNDRSSVVNKRSMVYNGSMVQQRGGVVDGTVVCGVHKNWSVVWGMHSVDKSGSVAVADDGVRAHVGAGTSQTEQSRDNKSLKQKG